MTEPIEPDINAYGTYGRVEALADWLELAALAGRRVTRAQLEQLIFDNGWTTLSPRQFLLPEGQEAESTPEEWVEAVEATLRRRLSILDDRWPFELRGSWRVARRDDCAVVGPYTAMLALTVAHAWRIDTPVAPEVVLESSAVRALTGIGLVAAAVGTAVTYEGGFPGVMRQAATSLGLQCNPDAAPRKASAKDEGVDTLALAGWPNDPRLAGQWLFLGQATVARSNEWYKKLMEPKPDHWRSRLLQPMTPRRFLVVPHHVSADYLAYLVTNESGLVVDRIRLALALTDVSPDEQSTLETVLSAGVNDGRAAA